MAATRTAFGPDNDPAARAAWLAARRTMITASDVPAILGIDPFKSAYSVWCEKTGVLWSAGVEEQRAKTSSLGVPFAEGADPTAETVPGLSIPLESVTLSGDDPISEAMLWGNLLEPAVADETARRLGRSILDHGRHTLFVRELVPILGPGQDVADLPQVMRIGCTPDREIVPIEANGEALSDALQTAGALEAKTFGSWADPRDEWREEGPARFAAQLQIQMFVLGFRWGVLAGLQGGQRLVYHVHEYNPRFIAHALHAIGEFWKYVEDRREPPVDAHPATTEAIADRYRAMRGGPDSSVTLSPRALMASAQLSLIADQERAMAQRRAECENVIKDELGDAEYGIDLEGETSPGFLAKVAPRVRWQKVTPTKATSCPKCATVVRPPPKAYRKLTGPWSAREPRED